MFSSPLAGGLRCPKYLMLTPGPHLAAHVNWAPAVSPALANGPAPKSTMLQQLFQVKEASSLA